jgi:hypothetical protein
VAGVLAFLSAILPCGQLNPRIAFVLAFAAKNLAQQQVADVVGKWTRPEALPGFLRSDE